MTHHSQSGRLLVIVNREGPTSEERNEASENLTLQDSMTRFGSKTLYCPVKKQGTIFIQERVLVLYI